MSPAKKNRLMLQAGMVLIALLALVVVPGYISWQPQFLDRYPEFDESYDTWSTSVHANVACQSCHVEPDRAARIAYGARMLSEFYISLVDAGREPALFPKPTSAACSDCHIDLRTVSPSGDLNIPHRAHVDVLEMECIECHRFLVHAAGPEGSNRPPMAGCLECHDGVVAKSECVSCHTDKDEPDTHLAETWLVEHPKQANAECNECHDWKDDWCADCHAQKPESHTADWRATHGDRVNAHRNCEACHETSFCVRCHGEVPRKNFDPLLKVVR